MGLQASQIVKPGRRSCRMWISVYCIVLVQPREPSPAIMIEPVPLRGSGFSSIRSGLSSNAQRLVCPSESTTHRDPGRLIGLAFCQHHVRPSQETLMATIDVYVAFVVGFCCIHLHNRSCAPASNLLVWVRNEPFQSTFLIQNGSECITRLSGSCQPFVKEDRSSPVSQAEQSRSKKTSCGVVQGGQEKNSFCGL